MENHHLTTLFLPVQGQPTLINKVEESPSSSSESEVLNGDINRNNQLSARSKGIKKSSDSKKKYDNISNELRLKLIEAVESKGQKIKLAAKLLGINYSSAKSICQIFKREGRSNKKIFKKKGPKEDSLNNIMSLDISKNQSYTSKSTDIVSQAKNMHSEASLLATKNTSLQALGTQTSSDEQSDKLFKKKFNSTKLGAPETNKNNLLNFPNPFKQAQGDMKLLTHNGHLANGNAFNDDSRLDVKSMSQKDLTQALPKFNLTSNNSISLTGHNATKLNNGYVPNNDIHNTLLPNVNLNQPLQNSLLMQNGFSGLAKNADANILGLSQINNLPFPNLLDLANGKETVGMNLNPLYHQNLMRPDLYPTLLKQSFLNNNLNPLQMSNPGLLLNHSSNLNPLNMFHQMAGGFPNLDLLSNHNLLQMQAVQKILHSNLNNEKK